MTSSPALADVWLTCTERTGGWCEESGFANTKAHAEYRINLPRRPVESGKGAVGTLQECHESACGKVWQVTARSNTLGDLLLSHADTERFQIHGKTGFFVRSSMMAGERLGRVEHTFGNCTIR
jgi:hypothetical protein